MPTSTEMFRQALRENAAEFGIQLSDETILRLSDYHELVLKWNDRLHLVAPCSPEEFATRHVLESLMLLRHLPANARVVDVGSGGGLPIIPCLIARPDLRATVIESSRRKAVFLREALRDLRTDKPTPVTVARFEQMTAPESEFVTCRALDRFQELLPALIGWAPPDSTFLLFTGEDLRKQVETLLPKARAERIPKSDRRYLIVARRSGTA